MVNNRRKLILSLSKSRGDLNRTGQTEPDAGDNNSNISIMRIERIDGFPLDAG